MKLSELDENLLTEEDKINLVMGGIKDVSELDTSKRDSSIILVPGCSPGLLFARVSKARDLVKAGISNKVIFVGGEGHYVIWNAREDLDKGWNRDIAAMKRHSNEPNEKEKKADEEEKNTYKKFIQLFYKISPDEIYKNKQEYVSAIIRRNNEIKNARVRGEEIKIKDITDHPMFFEGKGMDWDKLSDDEKERLLEKSYEDYKESKAVHMREVDIMKYFNKQLNDSEGELKNVSYYFEPFSQNTQDNGKYTKKLLEDMQKQGKIDTSKIDTMYIPTSGFHVRRMQLTLMKYFPDMNIISLPTTQDLEVDKFDVKKYTSSERFRVLILGGKDGRIGEYHKLIEYASKTGPGAIANPELSKILSKDMAEGIEKRQKQKTIHEEER